MQFINPAREQAAGGFEQAVYEAVVESLSDLGEGLMVLENRRFSYVNQGFCEMLGYERDELMAWNSFVEIFHPEERERILANHLRRLAGEQFRTCYETAMRHRDGHRVDIDMSIALLHFGERLGVVGIIRDISDRKLAEQEIKRKNEDLEALSASLEDKVRARTAELDRANKQLVQLNKVKSDFISIVSHELRTPLTAIKSFAEILLDLEPDEDQALWQRYLSIINTESDRLSRLIGNLLDLQKIDSGSLAWHDEIVDVVGLARECVELFKAPYREQGLQLRLEVPPTALTTYAEPDRIRQVIGNLLGNALKFTTRGGATLSVRRIGGDRPADNAGFIEVRIQDTGMGIAPAELDRVFDRFYQSDMSQKRKIGGTGLGLCICKDIVEHYHGEIRAESAAGDGATFTFTLPETRKPRKRLGEVLVDMGVVSQEALSAALDRQSED